MGRPPGDVPAYPNLALGVVLGRPGEDPGGTGSRLLAEVRRRGWPAGFLGADRGYTQALPERFHLPVRALGYSLVMDYKVTELGRQANSQGAVMVDGVFYCPAMPEALVRASCEKRAGTIDEKTFTDRISARRQWRLVRKKAPTPTATNASPAPPRATTPTSAARCGPKRRQGAWARSPCCPRRRRRPRSAPSRRSPSPPTSAPATARTWPSAQKTGLAPTPLTATPSRAGTAT